MKTASEMLVEWQENYSRIEKEQKKTKSKSIKSDDVTAVNVKTIDFLDDYDKKRYRAFSCITYIESEPLKKFLDNCKWINHYAFAAHDKDVDENGDIKKLHIHLLLYTFDAKTSSAVTKNFERFSYDYYHSLDRETEHTKVQPGLSMVSAYRYLTHKDDLEKFQYSDDIIVTDNLIYWTELVETDTLTDVHNKAWCIIQDMMNGLSTSELIQRYGMAYVMNYSKFDALKRRIDYENHFPSFDAYDLYDIVLNSSPLSQSQIDNFWNAFGYIEEKIRFEYKSDIKYYLENKELKK